ncbi:unnamed protein product [Lathyrus sativus]|nr:unnamed protein product [Lathyrus sativus]
MPWSFIGDFNTILGAHEYDGSFRPARGLMEEFADWTDYNHLVHMPTVGVKFTWANGIEGRQHTRKWLDRVICNQDWVSLCAQSSCSTLNKSRSDHYPILLHFNFQEFKFKSHFRFMQMWTLHPDCIKVVEDAWKTNFIGCPMFVLAAKLKFLKEKLKVWNKEYFGNMQDNVKKAELALENIQHHIDTDDHTVVLAQQEKVAQARLEQALNIESSFGKIKLVLTGTYTGTGTRNIFTRLLKSETHQISLTL